MDIGHHGDMVIIINDDDDDDGDDDDDDEDEDDFDYDDDDDDAYHHDDDDDDDDYHHDDVDDDHDDDSIHEVGSQEHLCLMGVAAYPQLAADAPYPPFDFVNMPDGVIKKLSGNAACLYFL